MWVFFYLFAIALFFNSIDLISVVIIIVYFYFQGFEELIFDAWKEA